MTPPPPIDEHLEAGAEGAVHGAILGSIARLRDTNVAELLSAIRVNDANLEDALAHLDLAHERIARLIASNRGSSRGMHGFIAEVLEVGISNARAVVRNAQAESVWVNDNGPIDILRAGVGIQQKFYSGPMSRILGAITDHAATYSDYVARGGHYQIPKDQYETLQALLHMSEHEASTTLTSGGTGPSYRDWKAVHQFAANATIPVDRIEASTITRPAAEAKVAPRPLRGRGHLSRPPTRRRRMRFAPIIGRLFERGSRPQPAPPSSKEDSRSRRRSARNSVPGSGSRTSRRRTGRRSSPMRGSPPLAVSCAAAPFTLS